MNKFISIEKAVAQVKEGMTVMVGGFLANGTPNAIVDALAQSGVKNLTLQGTLAERIRSGGAGLGGFLTTTGMGTIVAEGKPVVCVDGKEYLLEKPLRADIALVGASVGDKSGNLIYKGTSQNFNPLMASAADLVIAEISELVEVGELAPEAVRTPAIFVDYIVEK